MEDEDGRKVLVINRKIKPVCNQCGKLINEQIYFCPNLKAFFHFDCLTRGRHQLLFQTARNTAHEDYPIQLQYKKEVQNDN